MNTLTQAAASMQTMQCRFVQEKTSSMLAEPSVSEGVMVYAAPDRMRWEYTSPYPFALIVNGEQITKVVDGKAEKVDAKLGRMYKGIADIVMSSASGKKLFDTSVFDVVMYDDGDVWRAEMTPLRKDMKRMFSLLTFRFSKKTSTISAVVMADAKGDVTLIRFEEIKVNGAVDATIFEE